MKYRKIPLVIEAVEWTGENFFEIFEFCDGKAGRVGGESHDIIIKTQSGDSLAQCGDFIIKGVKGEIYPCDGEIFDLTYEQVKDEEDEIWP